VFHITDLGDFLLGVAIALLLSTLILRRDRRPPIARLAKWTLIAGVALLVVAVCMGAPTFIASFIAGWGGAGRH